jgi:hypothetical protein
MLGAFQTDRIMALFDERFEVAPGPAWLSALSQVCLNVVSGPC